MRWPTRYSPKVLTLCLGIAIAILIAIFSDPLARWWFSAIIAGGVLVAILLRTSKNDEGL